MHPQTDQLSAALEAVVTRFAGMVRQVAWRHRLSDADVDEVMQEVRVRLWRAHDGLDGASEQIANAPASYVYRTALSAALDFLRRRRARRAESMVELDEAVGAAPTGGPEGTLEANELAARRPPHGVGAANSLGDPARTGAGDAGGGSHPDAFDVLRMAKGARTLQSLARLAQAAVDRTTGGAWAPVLQ